MRYSWPHPIRQRFGVDRHRGEELDAAVDATTAYIEKGSPWENGYIESFNGKLRDELLHGEIFYSLREAQIEIEQWRQHYNTRQPHSSLGYRPTALEVIMPGAGETVASRPPIY
jgi:putative transposase